MAVDCVEEPGKRKAEDGPQEEQSKDDLLLQWGHKRDVWAKHIKDPQAQEEHTT